jgi:hypothetical protein
VPENRVRKQRVLGNKKTRGFLATGKAAGKIIGAIKKWRPRARLTIEGKPE